MTRLLLMIAAGVLVAGPARADDTRLPPVEFGGSLSAIVPVISEDGPTVVVGGGPRVTLNVSRRIAVELQAEALGPVESSGIWGLYLIQIKIPFRKSRGGERTLSLTAGAAGAASYQRFAETRIARHDGSTVVYPGYRRLRADAPNTLSIGVSRDHVLGCCAAGSVAVQTFIGPVGGLAVRASVGVSFGPGGYR